MESDVFSSRLFYPETSCVIILFCNPVIKKQKSPRPKFNFCFYQNIAHAISILMITVQTKNYNYISQDFYNNTVDSLDLNLISCTCGHSGCLIRHGSYKRNIQLADSILTLSVVRVYCKACGHTHALLLSDIVPYSQVPLSIHVRLIHAYEHKIPLHSVLADQCCVDENNLRAILRSYRLHWKQRLLSIGCSLSDIPGLVSACFVHFSRQFMQIKTTRNKLFIPPT